MLNRNELVELYRDLRHERVLSVYLDGRTHDFSERNTWRRRLEHEVDEARKRIDAGSDDDEAPAFDAALEHVESALASYASFLPEKGWVGFATPERLVYGQPVHVPMPDLARWEDGIRVAPYVRALKQDRLVLGILLDSRRARILEYRDGEMHEPQDLTADRYFGDLSDENMSKRAGTHSGVRGQTDTDVAQRMQRVGSERMLKDLVEQVEASVGHGGLVVLGGTPEVIKSAAHHLPAELARRTIQRLSMTWYMSDAELTEEVESAASDLNRRLQEELLSGVIDHARSGGRGALGPEIVEQALRNGQVDTLLLTRGFVAANPDYADHMVGAAFEHDGEVEELSFAPAERLDEEGQGVAARLRYVLNS